MDDDPDPVRRLRELLALHRLYFGRTDPARLVRLTPEVVTEIQTLFRALGVYRGLPTGTYDGATREAFWLWVSTENLEERWREDEFVDADVLTFLRRSGGTVDARDRVQAALRGEPVDHPPVAL